MVSVLTSKATSLLIFISILQGTQSLSIEHETEVNATVGQNLSLPCIISNAHPKIIQLQWQKEGEQGEQKLLVFNPAYPVIYYANVTLELVMETNTNELLGSILHLQDVTEKNSGEYVCDIASYPDGSIKIPTKVQVTEPTVSMEITSLNSTVIEGATVNITCFSVPSPDKYILLTSLSQSIIESQDGKFTIQNITRHISDLICQPLWNSSNQHLRLKATVHLTVDFLDKLECNSESQVQIETGTNLTITCEANSSTSLHFVWMKDNMTVSSSASINLWSLSPDHSGIYTLIVHSGSHSRLHRQKDFIVTVVNRTYTEDLSSTMTMETTPQISSTTMTTPEPNVTMPTSQPHYTSRTTDATSTEEVMYISTSAPSTGNVTMVHVNVTTPHTDVKSSATTFTHTSSEGRTLSEICCTSSAGSTSTEINYRHQETSTNIFTSAYTSKDTVRISSLPGKDVSTTKSHVVFAIIPVVLVLLLIGFLYRQYRIQRRLDMPPPFKPPPPPVKYTSARCHDIPFTDILV